MARRPAGQIRAAIVGKFAQFSYKRFAGESNAFQDVLWDGLEEDLKAAGQPMRIKRINHTQNKVGRIQAAEPRIKAVRFPRNYRETCTEAMRQLLQFPHAKHDDFPDSLEGCLSLLAQDGRDEEYRLLLEINAEATHIGFGAEVMREAF